jgi:hypothetical protein
MMRKRLEPCFVHTCGSLIQPTVAFARGGGHEGGFGGGGFHDGGFDGGFAGGWFRGGNFKTHH